MADQDNPPQGPPPPPGTPVLPGIEGGGNHVPINIEEAVDKGLPLGVSKMEEFTWQQRLGFVEVVAITEAPRLDPLVPIAADVRHVTVLRGGHDEIELPELRCVSQLEPPSAE